MLVLFRKDELLYVKCNINLKRPVRFHEKVFEVGNHVDLLLPEEVMQILTENGNIRLWNGKKFIKLNLGQFNDVMVGKLFKVELYVEPVKIKEEVSLDKDDIEILEDMIAIATNDALRKIEKEINSKLGNQAGALGGLF